MSHGILASHKSYLLGSNVVSKSQPTPQLSIEKKDGIPTSCFAWWRREPLLNVPTWLHATNIKNPMSAFFRLRLIAAHELFLRVSTWKNEYEGLTSSKTDIGSYATLTSSESEGSVFVLLKDIASSWGIQSTELNYEATTIVALSQINMDGGRTPVTVPFLLSFQFEWSMIPLWLGGDSARLSEPVTPQISIVPWAKGGSCDASSSSTTCPSHNSIHLTAPFPYDVQLPFPPLFGYDCNGKTVAALAENVVTFDEEEPGNCTMTATNAQNENTTSSSAFSLKTFSAKNETAIIWISVGCSILFLLIILFEFWSRHKANNIHKQVEIASILRSRQQWQTVGK